MVKGAANRRHLLPKLYKMCDDEFNGYIVRLVEAGLIVKRTSEGITYYDATLKAKDIKGSLIMKVLETSSKGIAEGAVNAIIKKLG